MPQAIYDYHYGMEAEQYAFFRIPKVLMTEPHFKNVSTDAKLLYGLMLDRMNPSGTAGADGCDGGIPDKQSDRSAFSIFNEKECIGI